MKRLKKLWNIIRNKIEYRSIKRNANSNSDKVYVDLGASNIKMSYRGELLTFRSSIRKVIDENEVTIQKNAISVNGEWFIVGESSAPTGNYEFKYQKEHLEVLILFGLGMIKDKVKTIGTDLKLNVLVPYNQIHTKKKLENRLNGVYQVKHRNNLGIQEFKTSMTLSNISVEGEASKVYFENNYKTGVNTCIVNIGYSTVDIALYNAMNCREVINSLNIGTNNLMSQYLRFTKAPTSNILSSWLNDGYKFTKEESKNISIVNEQYIKTLWNDIYNGCIKLSNPSNTQIIFCGGGSIPLINEFKQSIPKEYNVNVLNDIECVYSDLLGMIILSNDKVEPVEVKQTGGGTAEAKEQKKVSNYEKFLELKEKGLDNFEIVEATGLAIQTVRNYRSKSNKLQMG